MSAGELESGNAGEPAKLIRQRYREASDIIKKGKMCSLFINDLDAGAALSPLVCLLLDGCICPACTACMCHAGTQCTPPLTRILILPLQLHLQWSVVSAGSPASSLSCCTL